MPTVLSIIRMVHEAERVRSAHSVDIARLNLWRLGDGSMCHPTSANYVNHLWETHMLKADGLLAVPLPRRERLAARCAEPH